ncbi:MAG TPA: hypothetical protein VHO02_04415, partial [Fibrobacteria bacterium]|nr:hypothetical protein [Fibrobacteria bacterium]
MSYKKPILIEIYTLLVLEEDSFTDAKFFEFIPRIKEQGFSDVQLFPFGNPNASRASNKGLEINLSIMIPPAV